MELIFFQKLIGAGLLDQRTPTKGNSLDINKESPYRRTTSGRRTLLKGKCPVLACTKQEPHYHRVCAWLSTVCTGCLHDSPLFPSWRMCVILGGRNSESQRSGGAAMTF